MKDETIKEVVSIMGPILVMALIITFMFTTLYFFGIKQSPPKAEIEQLEAPKTVSYIIHKYEPLNDAKLDICSKMVLNMSLNFMDFYSLYKNEIYYDKLYLGKND